MFFKFYTRLLKIGIKKQIRKIKMFIFSCLDDFFDDAIELKF